MFKKIALTVSCILVLVVIGYFMTIGVGKAISTDLTIIGQGKPALVLAYENFSPASGDALNRLRSVRSDFDSRLDFVVADLGTPKGQSFANQYQLSDGQAIFLNQKGQPLSVTRIPTNEQELRGLLESAIAALR